MHCLKGIAREPLDGSNNLQADVIVKPLNSSVVKDNSDQLDSVQGREGLELSLGSDFSERHITSLGLNRCENYNDKEETDQMEEGRSGELNPSVGTRVSAILKAWVNPQFAPHCSPLKLKQLPGLDTECRITSSQLKDALFIGQVPFFLPCFAI